MRSDFFAMPSLLLPSSVLARERHAERGEECVRLLVVLGAGGDCNVEPADRGDRVVVDLRKDDLLADAERVVAASVEGRRAEAAEVADARQRDRDQPVEELPHPRAAQRHARADRHSLADLEARDGLASTTHLGTLAGDRRQLLQRRVELLRVGLRLADAHVERDLLDAGNLHGRAQAEVVLQARPKLALVELLQPRRVAVRPIAAVLGHYLSMSCPQSARLQTRILRMPSFGTSRRSIPMRVGRLQVGHTSITRDTGSGAGLEIRPPSDICWPPMRLALASGRGRVCLITRLRFSTSTLPSRGRASRTRPSLPRSLPARMCTVSPFLIFIACVTYNTSGARETIFMKFFSRNSRAT